MINKFKELVRPYVAITGWTAIVGMGVFLGVKYATEEIALMFVGAILTTGGAAVGYYLKAREAEKQ